jgi:hypothetical protein
LFFVVVGKKMKPNWYGGDDDEELQTDLPPVAKIIQRRQHHAENIDSILQVSSIEEDHLLVRQYKALSLGGRGGAASGPLPETPQDELLKMFHLDVPENVLKILKPDQIRELCLHKYVETSLKPLGISLADIPSIERLQYWIETKTKSTSGTSGSSVSSASSASSASSGSRSSVSSGSRSSVSSGSRSSNANSASESALEHPKTASTIASSSTSTSTSSTSSVDYRQKAIDQLAKEEGLRGLPGRMWLTRNKLRIDDLELSLSRLSNSRDSMNSLSESQGNTLEQTAAGIEPSERGAIATVKTVEDHIRNQIHCCVNPLELVHQGPPRDHGFDQVPIHHYLRNGPPRSSTY